jgi:hypothetical protein
MEHQGLTPGVEHGEESDLSAEMLRIGGDSEKRFRDCAEQQVVNHPPVLKRQVCKRVRQGEDYVVVGHRQQFFLPGLQPFVFGQ